MCGLDSSGLEQEPVTGSREDGNEPWGSIKGGEFLDCVTVGFSFRTLFHVISHLATLTFNFSLWL